MTYKNRIAHLKEEHARLDKQVDLMERTGNYIDDDLHNLKKKRLSLKDEIAALEHKMKETGHPWLERDTKTLSSFTVKK